MEWTKIRYKIKGVSMTDQDYYERLNNNGEVTDLDNAYIVISIPKDADFKTLNGEMRAYKFVSKVYEIQ